MVLDKNGEEKNLEMYPHFDTVNGFLVNHIAKVSSRLRCEKRLGYVRANPNYLPNQVNMIVPEEDPQPEYGQEPQEDDSDDHQEPPRMSFAKAAYLDRNNIIKNNKNILVDLEVLLMLYLLYWTWKTHVICFCLCCLSA